MTGENGAERVKKYSVPMAAGLAYNYAAKQVDDDVLEGLKKLAKEAQLTEKYAALYNGEMINTGEKRLVLHQLTRGQLGDTVTADGVDKRAFYVEQQQRFRENTNPDFKEVKNGVIYWMKASGLLRQMPMSRLSAENCLTKHKSG